MKIQHNLFLCSLLLAGNIFTSCKQDKVAGDGEIDVATAFSSPTELKASTYFTQVRYLPLETTDEGLIGRSADIRFMGDKLVVTTAQKQCFLFDARTGRFISSVGHIGNDPEGSRSVSCWIDEPNQKLNLQGWKGDWQQYDAQGAYQGKERFSTEASGTNFTYVDAQTVVAYQSGFMNGNPDSVFFYRNGEPVKAMAVYQKEQNIPSISNMNDIGDISVMSGDNSCAVYGPAVMSGVITINFKGNEKKAVYFDGATRFWHLNDDLYYKNEFNDTIYQVKGMDFIPSRVFNLGAYHWSPSERFNKEQDQNIYISHILETDDLMLFRFTYRLLNTDKAQSYNGIYDKRSGELKVNLLPEGIVDDLTHFLPFHPRTTTPSGEYACILRADEVTAWLEDHPGLAAKLPKEAEILRKVGEEDNPVIVYLR